MNLSILSGSPTFLISFGSQGDTLVISASGLPVRLLLTQPLHTDSEEQKKNSEAKSVIS